MELIPYSNIVGSMMYMMICTRPDLAHAISATSKQIHGGLWKTALEGSEVDNEISKGSR